MANFSISGKLTVGGATTLSSLTASRVLITDASKNIAVSAVTSTELGYLDGVTSSIQGQLNKKPGIIKSTNSGVTAEVFNDLTNNSATGKGAHAEGVTTEASGNSSHAEGQGSRTSANALGAHAEGIRTFANARGAHAEGTACIADGDSAHAEGKSIGASGEGAHAEGNQTSASAPYSHAEGHGSSTMGDGTGSHAEGAYTTTTGAYSHAEGSSTKASATAAHSEGTGTLASSANQHVQGKYNVEDAAGTYVHIVGWGSSDARKNIHTIDTSGNAVFAGKVTVQNTTPTAAGDLTTKSYVDSKASDTKVTNTLNNTVQAYVTGTTSASTNTGTQVFDSGVYLTTESGTLHVSKIEVGGSALSFDNDLQMLSISFA